MLLYAMYVNEIDLFRSIFIPCLDGMMAAVSTHFLYNKYCSRQVMTLPGQNSLHDIGFLQHCLFIFILEPRREKTGFLHMRKQRRRSASR